MKKTSLFTSLTYRLILNIDFTIEITFKSIPIILQFGGAGGDGDNKCTFIKATNEEI